MEKKPGRVGKCSLNTYTLMQAKKMQDHSCILPADHTPSRLSRAGPHTYLLIPASLSTQTHFPATPHGQPVQIPLQPAASGRHCLSARTIYTYGASKYSEFSEPTCFSLEGPGGCQVIEKQRLFPWASGST